MTYPHKSELHKKSIKHEFELLDNTKNILVISSHSNIRSTLNDSGQLLQHVFLLKQACDHDSEISILDENNVDSLNIGRFQFILLDDILEYLVNPKLFLTRILKFLENDGSIVCSVSNFISIINRIKILDGDFNNVLLDVEKKLHFFSLDNLLLLLSESNFSMTNLIRIKIDIAKSSQTDLKNYVIPTEIFDAITRDPESNVFAYVFSIKHGSLIDPSVRRWISEFSKNQVTETLGTILDDMRRTYEQANREQYSVIKHLEQEIFDKDAELQKIKQSTVIKLLRILDKFRGKNNV